MTTDLDTLNNDFRERVLPYLIPSARNLGIYFKSSGLTGNQYSVELYSKSFVGKGGMFAPTTSSFVHFTDLRALYSMINYGSIRLYNLNNLNDPNEFVGNLNDIAQTNQDFIDAYKKHTYILSMYDPNVLNKSHSNSLNMWRLYGREGNGVAIELEINNISTLKFMYIGKVKYNILDLRDFLKSVTEFETLHGVIVNYTKSIIIPAALHKNPAYAIEEEIRLVHQPEVIHPFEISNYTTPYIADVPKNDREFITYFEIPMDNRIDTEYLNYWQMPKIRIKSIQLGFKYPKKYFEKIKNEIGLIYNNLESENWIDNSEVPKVSQSPLMDVYR